MNKLEHIERTITLYTHAIIGKPLLSIIFEGITAELNMIKTAPTFNPEAPIILIIKIASLGPLIGKDDLEGVMINLQDKKILHSWALWSVNLRQIDLYFPESKKPALIVNEHILTDVRHQHIAREEILKKMKQKGI